MDQRDFLREMLAENGDTVVDAPFLCPRCRRIYEGAVRDAESGRVLIPGHLVGHPTLCRPPGSPVWDHRLRRQ